MMGTCGGPPLEEQDRGVTNLTPSFIFWTSYTRLTVEESAGQPAMNIPEILIWESTNALLLIPVVIGL
jgi:hypothetical protein